MFTSNMTKPEYDYLFKLLLVGSSRVGKSALVQRYVKDEFGGVYVNKPGIDFEIRTIELDNKYIKLQIWDTPGQERFRSIMPAYYRGAHGIFIIYDVTDRNSFDKINSYVKDIDDYAPIGVKRLLIGNKSDMLGARVISDVFARGYADGVGIPLIETSAKNRSYVDEAFSTMASLIMEGMGITFVNNRANLTAGQDQGAKDMPFYKTIRVFSPRHPELRTEVNAEFNTGQMRSSVLTSLSTRLRGSTEIGVITLDFYLASEPEPSLKKYTWHFDIVERSFWQLFFRSTPELVIGSDFLSTVGSSLLAGRNSQTLNAEPLLVSGMHSRSDPELIPRSNIHRPANAASKVTEPSLEDQTRGSKERRKLSKPLPAEPYDRPRSVPTEDLAAKASILCPTSASKINTANRSYIEETV
jgi:Ras-related protein Rab-1A